MERFTRAEKREDAMTHIEELYDVPEPPKMDDDYYNDLAEQSFKYEGSEDFQDCEDDGSGACEARDDSDVDPDEQERYLEQEAAKHSVEAAEYNDELQLEMMFEYGGCGENDDDPSTDAEEPESDSQRSVPERNVEGSRNINEDIGREQPLRPHDPSESVPGTPAENIVPRHGNSAGLEYYEPRTPEEYEQWCRDFGNMTDAEINALRTRKNLLELDAEAYADDEEIRRLLEMNTDELFFYAWMR